MKITFSSLAWRFGCFALLYGAILHSTAQAANIAYANNPGALNFTDGTNWVGSVAPGSGDIPVIDGVDGIVNYPYIDTTVAFQRFSIAAANDSTMGGLEFRSGANVTTSVNNSHFVGARGVGYMRVFDGATLDLAGPLIVGWEGTGTLNMSGGSLTTNNYLQIGRTGTGSFVQTGGDLAVFRSTGDAIVIAPFAGATGSYEISGGSLTVTVVTAPGGVANGVATGDSSGTFKVIGDAATITLPSYLQHPGSTLAFDIGSGISPVNVGTDVTLNGALNVQFTTTPTVGQQFSILNYGGILNGTFATFDSQVDSPAGVNSVGLSINYVGGSGSSIVLTVDSVGTSLVPGDFDGDGDVDGADFVVWQTNFPTAMNATLADGDADGDGDVDGADFVVWQTNFPFTPAPGVAAVPEPMTLILLALGGLVTLTLRWRV